MRSGSWVFVLGSDAGVGHATWCHFVLQFKGHWPSAGIFCWWRRRSWQCLFSLLVAVNLSRVPKKKRQKKVISFTHFESMTFEKNGILGNVKNNCTCSLRLLARNNAMDAIDLAICLSLTYLLSTCTHRCALHVFPCDFIQVLDAPWLRCGGSWRGSGGQCGSCHCFLTVTLLQLM